MPPLHLRGVQDVRGLARSARLGCAARLLDMGRPTFGGRPHGTCWLGQHVFTVETVGAVASTIGQTTRKRDNSLPSLAPGNYRITIHTTGFETIVREAIKLEVGDTVRLDFDLKIGDARTVVTVHGGPPLMNTEDASVGTVS
jgi:hypothetical protein